MFHKIQSIIADALYVESDEVVRGVFLVDDLGAESIDFLDITFRLEKQFNIRIPRGELEKKAKGNLSDAEFAINGRLTPAGIQQLRDAMPEVPSDRIAAGIGIRDIGSLFMVDTFERMVLEQLNKSETRTSEGSAAHGELKDSQLGQSI